MNAKEARDQTDKAIDNNAIVVEQSQIIDALIEIACDDCKNMIKYELGNIGLKPSDFTNIIDYYRRQGFKSDSMADNGYFLLVFW